MAMLGRLEEESLRGVDGGFWSSKPASCAFEERVVTVIWGAIWEMEFEFERSMSGEGK